MTKIDQYESLLIKGRIYNQEDLVRLLPQVLNERRYEHVLRVREKALSLAGEFQLSTIDTALVEQSALLHDFAKGMSSDELFCYAERYDIDLGDSLPPAYHAVAGAWMAEHFFAVRDTKVLEAVYYHTTGSYRFLDNKIGAVLFLADYLEPGRKYNTDEIKKHIPHDLLSALREEIKSKLSFVFQKNHKIAQESIIFYHAILEKEESMKHR